MQREYPSDRKAGAVLRQALFGCLMALAVSTAGAREFTVLGKGRGLDAGMVVAMAFDHYGFLWVGSREGLYRYDGYEALVFRPDPNDPTSISDGDIRALHVARDGALWIATSAGGINRYDTATDRFRSYRHDPANESSLADNLVYGIGEDMQGRIWATTRRGVNRVDPVSGAVERFVHDPANPDTLSNDWTFGVHLGTSGTMWISTVGGGVNRWDPKGRRFVRYDIAQLSGGEASRNDVFVMHEHAGQLWLGTRDGLVVLDPSTGTARSVDLGMQADLRPIITAMYADDAGRLWLGTMVEGVLVVDMSTGAWEPAHPSSIGAPGNLPAQPQISLAAFGGTLYVGTWGDGVYRTPLDEPAFSMLGTTGGESGLRNRNITAILPSESPGRPWIGSFGGGPQRVDVGRAVTEPGALRSDDLLANSGVLQISRASDHTLLAATTNGLFGFAEDGRTLWVDEIDAGAGVGLGQGYVTAVLSSPDGSVWVGQAGGGVRRRSLDGRYEAFPDGAQRPGGLASDYVTALQRGATGLWVGTTTAGLNRCRLDEWTCERVFDGASAGGFLGHRPVTDLYRDVSGRHWVATDGGGVAEFREGSGGAVAGFRLWTARDGFLSDSVMGIAEDSDGSVWFSSRQGLTRLDPDSGRIVNHVRQSGLPTVEFNAHAAAADSAYMYFGSAAGLVSVPTGTAFASRAAPVIHLSALERLTGNSSIRQPLGAGDRVRVPYDEALSVRFAVLDYAEVPHSYEYRLKARDAWTPIGTRRDLLLANLAPGSYRLEVRGRDVFGQWTGSDALSIQVVPPFWMTSWFRTLVVVAMAMLLLVAHRMRLGALRRRNEELEALKNQREDALHRAEASQQRLSEAYENLRGLAQRLESAKEEERLAISRELHDELGQSLTAAKFNLQLLRRQVGPAPGVGRLEDTVGMLDGMIGQVRSISLALRPPLLDEAGLVPALEQYLDTVAERSGVDIRLDTSTATSTGETPATRLTIFRIVQEAVNNALRHAAPKTIDVCLRADGGGLGVEVRDDGVGFDPQSVHDRARGGGHLGLLGMAERVHGCGGRFAIHARPGAGSRVEAWIPYAAATAAGDRA